MIEISDSQAEYIIENKELPAEITNAAEKVAVILTQNWCPQWIIMKKYLPEIDSDIKIFYQCYNIKPYSYKLMKVKETVLGNDLIPYVRYYKNGKLTAETNYVNKEEFMSNLS
ncbi:MAG: hypothetical protein PQJ61_12555 [Spirochaetales bacterium]|uniref:Thioredoxin n=1 Tax=Candidatus Thalassospirochaeta sargassi TaxID=3119039 RepID=A0AAJ1IGN6_9SPIO|nr:hypothetical protein [Spirochaetales bacterium]